MGAVPQARTSAAEIAEQQAECYRLQLEGLSVREIAKRVGLSHGTVQNRISAHASNVVQPLAEQVRQRHLDQIRDWLARLNAQLQTAPKTTPRCIEVGVRLLEREAKLLGIDAPERAEIAVTEVTQEDLALAELVREAAAKAAAEEQQIREGV